MSTVFHRKLRCFAEAGPAFRQICFFAMILVLTSTSQMSLGQQKAAPGALTNQIDLDPLRKYLPPSDLYIPVPGGRAALGDPDAEADSFEERRAQRNGGLLIGYCLKLSCGRVTHLAVLQICDNRIGGLTGQQKLILGVVRLPYGNTPGYVKALQGRNYGRNYWRNGPIEQQLTSQITESTSANYAVIAEGMGPVAALEYEGVSVKALQSYETITLQLVNARKNVSGIQFPRFEVRHLCEQYFG